MHEAMEKNGNIYLIQEFHEHRLDQYALEQGALRAQEVKAIILYIYNGLC